MKTIKLKFDFDNKAVMNRFKREDIISQTNNDRRFTTKVITSKKHKAEKYRNNYDEL